MNQEDKRNCLVPVTRLSRNLPTYPAKSIVSSMPPHGLIRKTQVQPKNQNIPQVVPDHCIKRICSLPLGECTSLLPVSLLPFPVFQKRSTGLCNMLRNLDGIP